MADDKYDVCVIGSGAAGGALAAALAEQGVQTVLVEGGPYRDPAKIDSHAWPYENAAPRVPPVRVNPKREPTIYSGDNVGIARARVLGGRTTHWNAVSLRFSADDFREWSVNGIEEDWPIGYDELAPYYDEAERRMVVCGTREGLEALPDGKFIRPLSLRCSERILQRASAKFGMRLIPVRKALATEPGRGRAVCHHCGHCMRGCGVSAIYNTAEHAIPQARETGNLDVRMEWMAHELLADNEGKVRAARFVEREGTREMEIRARVFAVCCGNIESPRLLLNSKSPRFPNGLANNNDNVGRYLHGHCTSLTFGFLSDLIGREPVNRDGAIDHAYIPRFAPYRKVDYRGGFGFQINIRSYMSPAHAHRLKGYGIGFKRRVRDLHQGLSVLGGYGKALAKRENRVTLHPARKDANGLPVPVVHFRWSDNDRAIHRDMLRTADEIYEQAKVDFLYRANAASVGGFASHEVGTCRMGGDPKTSVVNRRNQTHEVKNLFVVDGSSFTTFPEKNPTLTITALALRAADGIVEMSRRGEL